MNTEIEYEGFPIRSRIMLKIFMKVAGFARQGYPLIFFGPSGTGKEYLARYYFQELIKYCVSPAQFVSVNCSNFSEDLAISELFGHVKGAFTGAITDKKGLFEQIDNGVLFLDEIGDLLPRVQAMLLRALDSDIKLREGKRLGADKSYIISKNVIVICATEQSPEKLRESLLPRLGAQIFVPGMEDRDEDTLPALHWFLLRAFEIRRDSREVKVQLMKNLASGENKTENEMIEYFARQAGNRLLPLVQARVWPGNYRALRNAVNEAVVLANNLASVDHFSDEVVDNFREGISNYCRQVVPDLPDFEKKREDKSHNLVETDHWANLISHVFNNIDKAKISKIAGFLATHEEKTFKCSDFQDYIGLGSSNRTSQERIRVLKNVEIIISHGKGKSVFYTVNPGKQGKFIVPEHEFLSIPKGDCTTKRFTENISDIRERLSRAKFMHISIKDFSVKENFVLCLAAGLQEHYPVYYFSFVNHDFDSLLNSVISMLKNNRITAPFDEIVSAHSSTETRIALLTGFLSQLMDSKNQPVLLLDGIDLLKSAEHHQALLEIMSSWYFFNIILIGEKMETYLATPGTMEYNL